MLNVVQFLESLGASPTLSATGYVNAVEALGVDETIRDALLTRNADGINRLLGGRTAMRSLIAIPD